MNNVVIVGRLGADVEVNQIATKTGEEITLGKFTVAVNDPMSKSENVDWIKCRQFRCDNLIPYLTKGKLVSIQGRLKVDPYKDKTTGENKTSTYVLVERTELLSDGKRNEDDFTDKIDKKAPAKNNTKSNTGSINKKKVSIKGKSGKINTLK